MSKYTEPLTVGDRQVVRIRKVGLGELAGMRWVGFRITHPRGFKSLTGADYPVEGVAQRVAADRGWYVIGPQR